MWTNNQMDELTKWKNKTRLPSSQQKQTLEPSRAPTIIQTQEFHIWNRYYYWNTLNLDFETNTIAFKSKYYFKCIY